MSDPDPIDEGESELPRFRMDKDLRDAAATLGPEEARFLVSLYYTMQGNRIRAANQLRQLEKGEKPHAIIEWFMQRNEMLEGQAKSVLDRFSKATKLGVWARSIPGIGPVISSGLISHIDISKCPTVGHIWRFAGLDPTDKWEPKTKRPWNAELKTLCWKLGESFVKVSGNKKDIYGKVYLERKALEERNNELGQYAGQAAMGAARVGKTTEAYKSYIEGKLPKGHIHARAKRYAVKLFLSHFHHVGYLLANGTPPPKPYVISHLDHVHFLEPPNMNLVK